MKKIIIFGLFFLLISCQKENRACYHCSLYSDKATEHKTFCDMTDEDILAYELENTYFEMSIPISVNGVESDTIKMVLHICECELIK